MLLFGLTVSTLVGCSQNSAAVELSEISIAAPAEIEEDGTTWVSAEISAADQDCLARFFQTYQQLAGSPDMEGDPLLFTSGNTDRRFYWINATADGSRWMCVQFERGRYFVTEGTGKPY